MEVQLRCVGRRNLVYGNAPFQVCEMLSGLDAPFILVLKVIQFKRSLILGSDQKAVTTWKAPPGLDRLDGETPSLPMNRNWPVGIRMTG